MSERPVLSLLMPVYNERQTLATALDRLETCGLGVRIELIAVDDGSTDGSIEILRGRAASDPSIRPMTHETNRGKGAAIRTALRHASGDFVCVYDADLEYDPGDLAALLEPLLDGRTDIVYGTRMFGGHAAHSYWYVIGNRLLTTATNVLFNCYLRDIMTCYKLMSRELLSSLDLRSEGFEIEAEITGKLLACGYRIYEVPISYRARTHQEGKKLHGTVAASVLRELFRTRFASSA